MRGGEFGKAQRVATMAMLFAIAGCGGTERTSGKEAADTPAANRASAKSPAAESGNAGPSWRMDTECYWQLPQVDGGEALQGWLAGSDDGIVLNLVNNDAIEKLPLSDSLELTLRADGDPKREVAASGAHGDGDGATLLAIVINPPQRALMDGAERLSVDHKGQAVAELSLLGAPKSAVYAACDTDGGPGRIVTE
jgi:hypothetical protein